MTRRPRAVVPVTTLALSGAHVGSDFAQGAIPAIGAVLVSRGELDLTQVGVLVFAVNAGSSALQPLLGILADRFAWPWTASVGVVVAGIGLAGVGIAPTFPLMLAATGVCGIGIALLHPDAGRLVTATAPPQVAVRAMSMFALGGNIGFALGPVIAAPVAAMSGHPGIAALGLIPIAAAIPLGWATHRASDAQPERQGRTSHTDAEKRNASSTHINQWRPFTQLGIVITLRSAGYYSLQSFVPAYLIASYTVADSWATRGLTILVVAGTAATMLGGWRARRVPQMTLISWPLAGVTLGTLLLLAAPSYLIAAIALAIVGSATFAGFSPSITLAQNYLPTRTALASAVAFGLAPGLGSALAIPITRLAQHTGYNPALIVLAALPLVALPLALRLRPPTDLPSETSADRRKATATVD